MPNEKIIKDSQGYTEAEKDCDNCRYSDEKTYEHCGSCGDHGPHSSWKPEVPKENITNAISRAKEI